MPRRVSLPGASELFRPTGTGVERDHETEDRTPLDARRQELRLADPPEQEGSAAAATSTAASPPTAMPTAMPTPAPTPTPASEPAATTPSTKRNGAAAGRGSGRVRHEEKITVYVSSDELIALEESRLRLRAEHGLAVDRGRIVRQAISAAMADFAAHGAGSELVRKLSAS